MEVETVLYCFDVITEWNRNAETEVYELIYVYNFRAEGDQAVNFI